MRALGTVAAILCIGGQAAAEITLTQIEALIEPHIPKAGWSIERDKNSMRVVGPQMTLEGEHADLFRLLGLKYTIHIRVSAHLPPDEVERILKARNTYKVIGSSAFEREIGAEANHHSESSTVFPLPLCHDGETAIWISSSDNLGTQKTIPRSLGKVIRGILSDLLKRYTAYPKGV